MSTRDYTANVISATPVVPDGNFKTSKASGVWDINEALDLIKGGNWPNAANLDPAAFVDGLFNAFVYTTDGTSSKTITTGMDLSSNEGLVWLKRRSGSYSHSLFDTVRGVQKQLQSDATTAESTETGGLTAFTSTGFTIGNVQNQSALGDIVSWTFRKQPKFFDIVTYTGNATARTISHSLGSVPGMIIVKQTSGTKEWRVYHRGMDSSAPEDYYLVLNSTATRVDNADTWNDTAPTSTVFSVGSGSVTNQSGQTYVAYLFAHNNDDGGFGEPGDQDIIKCGSYTTDSSGNTVVDVGFEPQFVITKGFDYTSNWQIHDVIRGATVGGNAQTLRANNSDQEVSQSLKLEPNPTGFTSSQGVNGYNGIYMAIRRGGMQTPSTASDVFAIDNQTASSAPFLTSNFPVDMVIRKDTAGGNSEVMTRLTQGTALLANSDGAESSDSVAQFDFNDGCLDNTSTDTSRYGWMWKRARGYFDVVAYDGTGSARTVSHNLGVAPEMMWVKSRETVLNATDWWVFHKNLSTPADDSLRLNSSGAENTGNGALLWNSTTPTSSVFSLGTYSSVNQSGKNFIAYLFATVTGVSKVGSYTGSSSSAVTVDCGFSNGARFVLIKSVDGSGNWYLYDSVRGINSSADDAQLFLNTTDAETSNSNNIDPHSSGFTVTQQANSPISQNGETFIFYAIANDPS